MAFNKKSGIALFVALVFAAAGGVMMWQYNKTKATNNNQTTGQYLPYVFFALAGLSLLYFFYEMFSGEKSDLIVRPTM